MNEQKGTFGGPEREGEGGEEDAWSRIRLITAIKDEGGVTVGENYEYIHAREINGAKINVCKGLREEKTEDKCMRNLSI